MKLSEEFLQSIGGCTVDQEALRTAERCTGFGSGNWA